MTCSGRSTATLPASSGDRSEAQAWPAGPATHRSRRRVSRPAWYGSRAPGHRLGYRPSGNLFRKRSTCSVPPRSIPISISSDRRCHPRRADARNRRCQEWPPLPVPGRGIVCPLVTSLGSADSASSEQCEDRGGHQDPPPPPARPGGAHGPGPPSSSTCRSGRTPPTSAGFSRSPTPGSLRSPGRFTFSSRSPARASGRAAPRSSTTRSSGSAKRNWHRRGPGREAAGRDHVDVQGYPPRKRANPSRSCRWMTGR
jgi:hypothetical protein